MCSDSSLPSPPGQSSNPRTRHGDPLWSTDLMLLVTWLIRKNYWDSNTWSSGSLTGYCLCWNLGSNALFSCLSRWLYYYNEWWYTPLFSVFFYIEFGLHHTFAWWPLTTPHPDMGHHPLGADFSYTKSVIHPSTYLVTLWGLSHHLGAEQL